MAQRQMQQKQCMVPMQTFVDYQNSLPTVIERGLSKLRCHPEICNRLKKVNNQLREKCYAFIK